MFGELDEDPAGDREVGGVYGILDGLRIYAGFVGERAAL